MSEAFIAEIRIFAGNFAPLSWALCDGQIMPIAQNTALFSLLGTTYGGDGRTTFALPNLQGCAPMQAGQGSGLSVRDLGESAGEQTVTLLDTEIPAHTHDVVAAGTSGTASPANNGLPGGHTWAQTRAGIYTASTDGSHMAANALAPAGSSQPHNNMMPYLGLTFIIALSGIFPPRS